MVYRAIRSSSAIDRQPGEPRWAQLRRRWDDSLARRDGPVVPRRIDVSIAGSALNLLKRIDEALITG
jgi:hypothetical protein